MPNRPVYWHEGMFLGPHHFQVADRQTRLSIKESEDWFHPFCWGVRLIELDEDALASHQLILHKCQVRFPDGTRLSIPVDGSVEAPELVEELKKALTNLKKVVVYLAIPTLQAGKPNVDDPTAAAPRGGGDAPARPRRYWVEEKDIENENSGGDDQKVKLLRIHCRLLLSSQKVMGYQVVPLFQVAWKGQAGTDTEPDDDENGDENQSRKTTPTLDRAYVPPLLTIDAWPPLWGRIQNLHRHVVRIRNLLADQVAHRYLMFESNVPGDAERLLMLSVLNGVDAALGSFVHVMGLTPFDVYRELCRVLGQLSTFGPGRTTPDLMGYKHDELGPCFDEVIRAILALLRPYMKRAFEKEYFVRVALGDQERERLRPIPAPAPTRPAPAPAPEPRTALGLPPRRPTGQPPAPPTPPSQPAGAGAGGVVEWLQVNLKPEWFGPMRSIYLGVETKITPEECVRLLRRQNMKLASGDQVREFGRQGFRDLNLDPITHPPDELKLRDVVFYKIKPDKVAWPAVHASGSIGLFFVSQVAGVVTFLNDTTVRIIDNDYPSGVEMRFALFVIKVRE